MANVGTAAAGKTLVGAGTGVSPTFVDIGTNSGLTNHAVVLAQGNNAFTNTSAAFNGQVLIGSTGSNPNFATITSTDGSITFSSGANSLNMAVTSPLTSLVGQDGISVSTSLGITTVTPRGAGTRNMFLGQSAGNLTLSGSSNVGYGYRSEVALTTGSNNVAMGTDTLSACTTGENNVAIGYQALKGHSNSINNTAVGYDAMELASVGSLNVCIGLYSGRYCSTSNNVGVGYGAIAGNSSTGGGNCVGVGFNALISNNGTENTGVGYNALARISTGAYHVCLGRYAGYNYTGAESSNICLGNQGTTGDSNTIRLGSPGSGLAEQDKCFIAGITGVTAVGEPVAVGSTGKMSALGFGTSGNLFVSNGAGVSPTWLATANNSILSTNGSGIPSLGTSLSNDYTFTSSTSGANRVVTISHTSNTASSGASENISVAGTSGGDAWTQYTVGTSRSYSIGPDTSDSSILKINTDSDGTVDPSSGTNLWKMTSSGVVNMPLQPSFLASLSATQSNVTGDATVYQVVYDTEITDQGSNYNNGTGTFTAPVSGNYLLIHSANFSDATASFTIAQVRIVTTARTFIQYASDLGTVYEKYTGTNTVNAFCSIIAPMAANDTATFSVLAAGSTKTTDVLLTSTCSTSYCSGYLLC